jgi:glyoxylate/hydroxypyruvate reductase
LGNICAKHLKQIGFNVVGWSYREKRLEQVQTFHGEAGLQTVLERADIVVNLLPLTPDTKSILNAKTFGLMKGGVGFVNVARGAHVVEEDLISALNSKRLSHAILDVFTQEPLPKEHPFWIHPNITVLPHVAAITNPVTASRVVAQNVLRLRAGEPLENLVDVARGY